MAERLMTKKGYLIICEWCGKHTPTEYYTQAKYCPSSSIYQESRCLIDKRNAKRRERRAEQAAKALAKKAARGTKTGPQSAHDHTCVRCDVLVTEHPRCARCDAMVHEGDTKQVNGVPVCHGCLKTMEYEPRPIEYDAMLRPSSHYGE